MLDKSKASLDPSIPLGEQQLFLNHDFSPFGQNANMLAFAGAIESSFAITSRRV
jgi:hypothetical protein